MYNLELFVIAIYCHDRHPFGSLHAHPPFANTFNHMPVGQKIAFCTINSDSRTLTLCTFCFNKGGLRITDYGLNIL